MRSRKSGGRDAKGVGDLTPAYTPVVWVVMRLALAMLCCSSLAHGGEAPEQRLKRAHALVAQGQFDEAATEYLDLVSADPKGELAPNALRDAAACYERAQRFDLAEKIHSRLVNEYPSSKLADGALFGAALNAEKLLAFDKAIERYEKLVKDYPASTSRENALSRIARLLDDTQRYPAAAIAYLRSADAYPKNPEAPRYQLRAAELYEREEEPAAELAALKAYVKKFGSRVGQDELNRVKQRVAVLEQQAPDAGLAR